MSDERPTSTTDATVSLRQIVQIIPSLAFGGTTICFALGLLIVNIRLARYGIYSSEFIRTEYVLVGAMYILLVTIAYVSFLYGIKDIKANLARWRDKKRTGAVVGVVLSVLLAVTPISLVFLYSSESKFYVDNWRMWLSTSTLAITGWYVHELSRRALGLWEQFTWNLKSNPAQSERVSGLFNTLGFVPFLLISVIAYAHTAYPYLSSAVGGGRKDPIVVVPTERGLAVCAAIGCPIQVDGKLIGPLELLSESDTELIVLPIKSQAETYRAIRLNRTLFEAVLTAYPGKKALSN